MDEWLLLFSGKIWIVFTSVWFGVWMMVALVQRKDLDCIYECLVWCMDDGGSCSAVMNHGFYNAKNI
jgi:hypothetical protein